MSPSALPPASLPEDQFWRHSCAGGALLHHVVAAPASSEQHRLAEGVRVASDQVQPTGALGPYDEVGVLLGIDPAAARKRYGRALVRLERAFGDRGIRGIQG